MPRGGRQHYDPIVQAPATVQSASSRRIELFPEQDVRDNAATLRWVARLVDEQGRIIQKSAGSFDHDDALRQAQELWPGLEVFELREESEDSTWEGMGPSPRLWQRAIEAAGVTKGQFHDVLREAAEVVEAHQGSSPGDADGASQEPDSLLLPEGVGASPEPGDDELPPAGALRVLPIGEPGMYVLLGDVLSLLHVWESQYAREKNPSAAMALQEVREALATAYEGGQDG